MAHIGETPKIVPLFKTSKHGVNERQFSESEAEPIVYKVGKMTFVVQPIYKADCVRTIGDAIIRLLANHPTNH